jgi:small subunit ribosomal protein S35
MIRPTLEDLEFDDDLPEDTTWAGHQVLAQQREELYYQRLIEHEMPKLVAFRKPFVPPTSASPLIVRSITYVGEKDHPVTPKRVVTVPVSQLPLAGPAAQHKFKLLAGARWTPEPPKDAGLGKNESLGEHGYFKISCEDFPKAAMNLKWISDTIDRLIVEANDSADSFADVPLDLSHVYARARKAKKGEHYRGRLGPRPTLRDFPKEWLPDQPLTASPSA